MTEAEKRLRRCCFTGHRPEKLNATEAEVTQMLYQAIEQAISEGYSTFVSGMARGVDIWAAECVLALRRTNPDIHLICALPHPDFEQRWAAHWRERYQRILENADWTQIVSPVYSKGSYQKRNEWMVDRSALVLAVCNGEPGGTRNTIGYAQKHGVTVRILTDSHP